jgi:DNA-binding LytR/AlgR family response regulator
MTLKCIIVDDELMARTALKRLCEQNEALELVAVCEHAEAALQLLADQPIDLLWLDVEMPGLSGFQLLEQLAWRPLVVLTTSKTEYAFTAFQYEVTDYLHKPITLPRFNAAVQKALDLSRRRTAAPPAERKEIYIRTDGRYLRLPFDDIQFIENMGDYVKISTHKHVHVVHTTMRSLEEKLGSEFLRVHRSFIVHLGKILDIEESNLVIGGKVIPISRTNKAELMNRLNLL